MESSGCWSWCCFSGGIVAAKNEDSDDDINVDASAPNYNIRKVEKMLKSVLRHGTERNRDLIHRLERNQETVKKWLVHLLTTYANRSHSVDADTEIELDFESSVMEGLRALNVEEMWLSASMIQLAKTFEEEGNDRDHEEIVMDWLTQLVTPPPGSPSRTETGGVVSAIQSLVESFKGCFIKTESVGGGGAEN